MTQFQIISADDFCENTRLRAMAKLYAQIPGQESTEDEIYKALVDTEAYNELKYQATDMALDYDDEIVEIIELEDGETMDISVAGDQLFYADGVLTKNSAGLPATADFMLAIIETEQLAQEGLQLMKQIKSRYGDKNKRLRFPVKVLKGLQMWCEAEIDQAGDLVSPPIAQPQSVRQDVTGATMSKADIASLASDIKFSD